MSSYSRYLLRLLRKRPCPPSFPHDVRSQGYPFPVFSLRPTRLQCILTIKPRPNDRNISTPHLYLSNIIPTLLAQHLLAAVKRSRHLNVEYPNIVECNMLHAFSHPVAPCCDMPGLHWPNDYNIMQNPQMSYEKFDHFQI